ncbi:hypothetical protein ABW19_dt0210158 [Dactylella cylindrospora]|nr:hypothetical protein ABW19_dt0210158 [Dactylella cylindrospora]
MPIDPFMYPLADDEDDIVDHLEDSDLSRLIHDIFEGTEYESPVVNISPDYVVKSYLTRDELLDMSTALSHALSLGGIRAPPIKRILPSLEFNTYAECIFPCIPGDSLLNLLPRIGIFKTIHLALQLRGMLKHLRSSKPPPPRSHAAGSMYTGKIRSFDLQDAFGVPDYSSPSALAAVVNFWYQFVPGDKERQKSASEHEICVQSPISGATPLVFVHHDLAPRNMLVDPFGNLWLIDWDFAGWYPEYFEYAKMNHFTPTKEWNKWTWWKWKLFYRIAVGWRYRKESKVMWSIGGMAQSWGGMRWCSVHAGATPCIDPDGML